jgi:hypothetical protein
MAMKDAMMTMKGARVKSSLFDNNQFFHQKLYEIGNGLEDAIKSDTVGADTVLHECADLPFGIDQEQPDQCIEQQEHQPDDGKLRDECPERRQQMVEPGVDPLRY